MEYLEILYPESGEMPTLSSLKSVTMYHYHVIGIILGLPLGELFCFCGFRVNSATMTLCHNRLRSWVKQCGREARQVVFHASRVFGHLRRSKFLGCYEGRAMMIACLSLWVYGKLAEIPLVPDNETDSYPDGYFPTSTIRLDQNLSKQIEESWVQAGAGMRPYLAGVGNILGAQGVSRLIQEGSRVLCASSTWRISDVMGKSLRIFHKLQSGTE